MHSTSEQGKSVNNSIYLFFMIFLLYLEYIQEGPQKNPSTPSSTFLRIWILKFLSPGYFQGTFYRKLY